MQIVLLISGAAFIAAALAVTIRRLVQSPPRSKPRAAMWATVLQLAAVAAFLVLAAQNMHSHKTIFWLQVATVALMAINVVVTLVLQEKPQKPSA